ncbi:hypothetical protein NPIL_423671 [Nephila pilipes]|uniref:C2H2-type domain-containing protein n=1 Tax=Nephila pilipes TaxID=299642 RepID=A0A8X6Q0K7_NEPPI|nr:hypothetical protein NPIL_423671 [Nephila pilipes]
MSSSDEEIPQCERPSTNYEPHSCESIDLSILATPDASSRSDRPSIISFPFSEESPSDHKQVGTSELPGPVIIRDVSSNSCDLEMTLGHQQPKQSFNKEFPCSVCSKLFTGKRSLKTHMRIHMEKKQVTCETCGESFTTKGCLKNHMKMHSEKIPFTCDTCGRKFPKKSNLKIHIDSVHNMLKPFICNLCEKQFSRKESLKRHIHNAHNKDNPFSCKFCKKQYAREESLKKHIRRVHVRRRRHQHMDYLVRISISRIKQANSYIRKRNLPEEGSLSHNPPSPYAPDQHLSPFERG